MKPQILKITYGEVRDEIYNTAQKICDILKEQDFQFNPYSSKSSYDIDMGLCELSFLFSPDKKIPEKSELLKVLRSPVWDLPIRKIELFNKNI